MLTTAALLIAGLVVLILGAEWLVRGASRLAATMGIAPLVIGLTVVAFGTSAPELAVSVRAAWAGNADIAVGNVVGSNIFNVLFILGLSALITPLLVDRQLVRLDVPVMVLVSLGALLLALDGHIGRIEGLVLVGALVTYIAFLFVQARREGRVPGEGELPDDGGNSPLRNLALIAVGLASLVLGAHWLVQGAVGVAQALGISELVIGLTVIAAGTSLPEVATSVVAALRGERDIAVGNVVGSNIFNILSVLGITALVAPDGIAVAEAALHFDIPVMIAAAILCLPVFMIGHNIARWEGGLFFGCYVAYTTYLILGAARHPWLATYADALVWIVLPAAAVTAVAVWINTARARR